MLPRRIVKVPAVHGSETVLRGISCQLVRSEEAGALHAGSARPGPGTRAGHRVRPGVGLEPPAPGGLHQGSHATVLAGFLERGVVVVAPQHVGVGVSGQYGADRGRVQAGRAMTSDRVGPSVGAGTDRQPWVHERPWGSRAPGHSKIAPTAAACGGFARWRRACSLVCTAPGPLCLLSSRSRSSRARGATSEMSPRPRARSWSGGCSYQVGTSGSWCSAAEPLEADNEHEIIRWVDQKSHEALVVVPEM